MIHFQLSRTTHLLYKYLNYVSNDSPCAVILSHSLSHYLGDIKHRIENQEEEWDVYKRYSNPYEYIHTTIPNKRKSVSIYKPLSRSYFKMIEISLFFRLLEDKKSPIRSFHLAEGPGGFIEALVGLRKCKDDVYTGMTILEDQNDPNIPGWKKSHRFLEENTNVRIETGADGTGNILKLENLMHCIEKYGSSMDVITGDGGFDFSLDFNNQERNIVKLLFGQVVYALCMQKRGGCFVLKVFDCFTNATIDILALLSSFYEKVYITKPQTSRYANSEKYVVCKNFLFETATVFVPELVRVFSQMITTDQYVQRFLSLEHSLYFLTKLEEYNAVFGQQQIENIYYTLSFIEQRHKQDKIDNIIRMNIQKCVAWCNKYMVPFHAIT
jgi:23S rRNA U2552 (ribose-2'-O)-methylase RlmE/FtsJ